MTKRPGLNIKKLTKAQRESSNIWSFDLKNKGELETSLNNQQVRQRADQAKTRMQRNAKMYKLIDKEYEVSSDRYLQRHNIYLQELFTKAMIVLLEETKSGPTVQKWRDLSGKNMLVARYIVAAVYAKRGPVTMKELFAATKDKASQTSVETCVRDGKDLKLLRRTKAGYLPTELLVDQLQDRLGEKLMNDDVQRFFKFAVMWADQRQFALDAIAHNGDRNFEGEKVTTFLEQILDGTFDRTSQTDLTYVPNKDLESHWSYASENASKIKDKNHK